MQTAGFEFPQVPHCRVAGHDDGCNVVIELLTQGLNPLQAVHAAAQPVVAQQQVGRAQAAAQLGQRFLPRCGGDDAATPGLQQTAGGMLNERLVVHHNDLSTREVQGFVCNRRWRCKRLRVHGGVSQRQIDHEHRAAPRG